MSAAGVRVLQSNAFIDCVVERQEWTVISMLRHKITVHFSAF